MRTVLLLLVLSATAYREAETHEHVPYRIALQTDQLFEVYHDGQRVPPLAAVLNSREEARAFLDRSPRQQIRPLHGGRTFRPFPLIDYETETAVVLTLGTRGSGSVGLRVDSVVAVDGRATVYATEVRPCVGNRAMAHPAVVLALKGGGRAVAFAPVRVEEVCW